MRNFPRQHLHINRMNKFHGSLRCCTLTCRNQLWLKKNLPNHNPEVSSDILFKANPAFHNFHLIRLSIWNLLYWNFFALNRTTYYWHFPVESLLVYVNKLIIWFIWDNRNLVRLPQALHFAPVFILLFSCSHSFTLS